jgi:hypothetical protein
LDSRAIAEWGHCALRCDDTESWSTRLRASVDPTVGRFGRFERSALRQSEGNRLYSAPARYPVPYAEFDGGHDYSVGAVPWPMD